MTIVEWKVSPTTYPLWTYMRSPWANCEVAYAPRDPFAIDHLCPGTRLRSKACDVELVPEAKSHDADVTFAVMFDGHILGHLSTETKKLWDQPLRRIVSSGLIAVTSGVIDIIQQRIWGDLDPSRDAERRMDVHLSIALDDPHTALPVNDPPSVAYTLLPRSGIVQVSKPEQSALSRHVPGSGYGMAFATLREQKNTPPNKAPLIEVWIDADRIGMLTPNMSREFLPAVRHFDSRDLVTACWADITRSGIRIKARLDVARSDELSDTFLSGPPVVLPRLTPYQADPLSYELPRFETPARGPESRPPSTASDVASVKEPPEGSVVRWDENGYLYVAIRVGELWLTTAANTAGNDTLPQRKELWRSLVRCQSLQRAVAWSYGTLPKHDRLIVRFDTTRGPRAALKICESEKDIDWYVSGDGIADDGLTEIRARATGEISFATKWERIRP